MTLSFRDFISKFDIITMFEKKEKEGCIGTYAALRLSSETIAALDDFCLQHNIPNKVDEYHSTIMYSRKSHPDFEAFTDREYFGTPINFGVFLDREHDTKCLVLKYSSLEIEKRHYNIRNDYEATYDFETFEPHITLSYDIGDFDISSLEIQKIDIKMIMFTGEFSEPLSLNIERRNSDR